MILWFVLEARQRFFVPTGAGRIVHLKEINKFRKTSSLPPFTYSWPSSSRPLDMMASKNDDAVSPFLHCNYSTSKRRNKLLFFLQFFRTKGPSKCRKLHFFLSPNKGTFCVVKKPVVAFIKTSWTERMSTLRRWSSKGLSCHSLIEAQWPKGSPIRHKYC